MGRLHFLLLAIGFAGCATPCRRPCPTCGYCDPNYTKTAGQDPKYATTSQPGIDPKTALKELTSETWSRWTPSNVPNAARGPYETYMTLIQLQAVKIKTLEDEVARLRRELADRRQIPATAPTTAP